MVGSVAAGCVRIVRTTAGVVVRRVAMIRIERLSLLVVYFFGVVWFDAAGMDG